MADDRPVPPALVREHIESCKDRWDDNERRTRALEEAMTEHRMRLENGRHVFDDMRKSQAETHETLATKIAALTPKPPSPLKVASVVLTVVALAGGALWTLSAMLSNRPTTDQIKEVIHDHDADGHEDMKRDIREVHLEQTDQKSSIEDIKSDVKATDGKVDELLERVPDPDKRRRR